VAVDILTQRQLVIYPAAQCVFLKLK